MTGSPTITLDLKDKPQWRKISRSRLALEIKRNEYQMPNQKKVQRNNRFQE